MFPLRCCRDGDSASLLHLVTAGSHSIFAEDSLYGWTPIHWASRFDHVQCLDVLVRQTSLVNSCDIQVSGTRQTPLHVAAELGALNAIRWLTLRGADPNQKVCQYALNIAAMVVRCEPVILSKSLCLIT